MEIDCSFVQDKRNSLVLISFTAIGSALVAFALLRHKFSMSVHRSLVGGVCAGGAGAAISVALYSRGSEQSDAQSSKDELREGYDFVAIDLELFDRCTLPPMKELTSDQRKLIREYARGVNVQHQVRERFVALFGRDKPNSVIDLESALESESVSCLREQFDAIIREESVRYAQIVAKKDPSLATSDVAIHAINHIRYELGLTRYIVPDETRQLFWLDRGLAAPLDHWLRPLFEVIARRQEIEETSQQAQRDKNWRKRRFRQRMQEIPGSSGPMAAPLAEPRVFTELCLFLATECNYELGRYQLSWSYFYTGAHTAYREASRGIEGIPQLRNKLADLVGAVDQNRTYKALVDGLLEIPSWVAPKPLRKGKEVVGVHQPSLSTGLRPYHLSAEKLLEAVWKEAGLCTKGRRERGLVYCYLLQQLLNAPGFDRGNPLHQRFGLKTSLAMALLRQPYKELRNVWEELKVDFEGIEKEAKGPDDLLGAELERAVARMNSTGQNG